MNDKKRKIIETAISLFAQKGFYSTSMQEIADQSGISKGSVYLQFQSKDDLMLKIFEYYYTIMREKVDNIQEEQLPPKEQLTKQLQVHFEEITKHKEFIIMQFREQTLSQNKVVEEFLWKIRYETHKWYEDSLLGIYGEKIRPYVVDASLMLDGMKSSYLQLLIMDTLQINLADLSSFIVRRVDDVIQGMLSDGEKPLLTEEIFKPMFANVKTHEEDVKEEVEKYLYEMEQVLPGLKIDEARAEELRGAIGLLKQELQNAEPKKFIFQGMLANFKGIDAFKKYRSLIADRMGIELL